jgi:hypothetical protein
VHGTRITPVRVIEDSRCPAGVSCIWAGRVRIAVRIGGTARELTLGEATHVTGGSLQFAQVLPARRRAAGIPLRAYRFGFRFEGAPSVQLIGDYRKRPGA